jgi:hypothetical protein
LPKEALQEVFEEVFEEKVEEVLLKEAIVGVFQMAPKRVAWKQ